MGTLKVGQMNSINDLLLENDLIKLLEEHLSQNNINDIEIELIKFKRKGPVDHEQLVSECGPGKEKILVCTISGKCTYKCVDI